MNVENCCYECQRKRQCDGITKNIERYSSVSNQLSLSGAMVRVYTGNEKPKTFYVPKNNVGTVWHVFDIDENGITPVNEFYSSGAQGVR
ncbi:MAG: hypothetical protein NC092_09375, partial [Butyrivibrio sp.]|nr:hypothetical protein [Butyrivibrio sp.]